MMYMLYECRAFSFNYTSSKINQWKSTGLYNFNSDSHIDAVAVSNNDLPSLVNNGRLSVKFDGCYFKQTILVKPNDNKVINVYIVYKLYPISRFRSDTYTVQNALFGGVKIAKNATDKVNTSTKDTVFVLMKVVRLVRAVLTMEETFQFLEYMKIRWYTQIIRPIIFILWVILLYKA